MRRLVPLLVIAAALLSAVPASAELQPVRRSFGELDFPRVRAGEVQVPPGHARGRTRVIVQLEQPPLARYARTLQGRSAATRLNASSASSRAYLAQLARAQSTAIAQLQRAIPQATVSRRYRVVLNGFAVELPAAQLPTLLRQPWAHSVAPSVRYTLAMNRGPDVIAAEALGGGSAGRGGEGIRIAIVDDGVDPRNPFFDPSGYRYPEGFPRGGTAWTTPKVIVARSFPGPNAGRPGRLAVDPEASFHGTHVAGIAAGNANTTAPAGGDHPAVQGLAGVAPRAYIGNYRVFNVPTPIGNVANSPEIAAAFEAAVLDGMDVINFSGGGPSAEPVNDPLVEAIANVAAAGVVPVISAGNDRDEFGLGSAGAPGIAPEAISVAAVSNEHVFSAVLEVDAPDVPPALRRIPLRAGGAAQIPPAWARDARTLVDVGTILGTNGAPVRRDLCGPPSDPNAGAANLPPGSLAGSIALAERGRCAFVAKAERARAAGAAGLVLSDNRPGEANSIPIPLGLPAGMIADLDGAQLRAALASSGGRARVRIDLGPHRLETGRSGVVTSFTSAGPTAFGHQLKPDVAAPGGQILSATLPRFGGPFAVFDGTSMAAPHVAGAAALLLERHRSWTPRQVKAALVATAGAAWADTARTREAPVILQGGGLVHVGRAAAPLLFTDPVSLSFDDLNVNHGARSHALLARVGDAGGGAGAWQVELRPQSASAGASIDLPATLAVPPGGDTTLPAVARASADAAEGENYGFVVLRRGDAVRRIPYFFLVSRPKLEAVPVRRLQTFQLGDTLTGPSHASQYRYPAAPFGPPPDYTGPPMRQDGAEKLYVTRIDEPVANFGVSVILSSEGSLVDPWVLGSRDENDVQGYAGTPVNVNGLTFGYRADIGAAGASMPKPGTYYVSVDSGRDAFTGRSLAGRYLLQSWVNDVVPPAILPMTTRIAAGRPTLVMRIVDRGVADAGSGVDPLSLAVGYAGVLVGAAAYDPTSGIAVFPLPPAAPVLRAGRRAGIVIASDYQEAKNVNTSGPYVLPNTSIRELAFQVVNRPTVDWLAPETNDCAERQQRLLVAAGSNRPIRSVRFTLGSRTIATVRRGTAGLYAATWRSAGTPRGRHVLRAVVTDAQGRTAAAARAVRVCR